MTTQTRTLDWDIVLRDGATIHVRPFDVPDVNAVRAFLAAAAQESLFARFFGMMSIEHFDVASLDSTDPTTRCTFLAEAGGRVLAMATYVRRRYAPNVAEVGFLVADQLQGHGLGTRGRRPRGPGLLDHELPARNCSARDQHLRRGGARECH
jgi:hypothetical protein